MGWIKTLHIVIFFLFIMFFAGCGSSGFLDNKDITSLSYKDAENNTLILYKVDYTFRKEGNLSANTHSILKVGKNTKSLPDYFSVYDGSMEKLRSYSCRIIKKDGSTENYSKSDLRSYSLKSNREISENSMLFVFIEKDISPGDLIETVYEHELTLPQLGINFNLPDFGEAAYNLSCSINIPDNLKLNYLVINDNKEPLIINDKKGATRTYLFEWPVFNHKKNESVFAEKLNFPGILAAYPFTGVQTELYTWKDFGSWYLTAIKEKTEIDSSIHNKGMEITKGLNNDLDKMNAIFNYCQNNVRYEQVYLAKGEFIPNLCSLILSRKYGDCKDYATLIYSLAKSIGLKPELALCYRGRGEVRFYDIPVSQFNHAIVHYTYDGKDFWFDGTNRSGTPGITTTDLINQTALVLKENKSHLQIISENPGNKLLIEGNLSNSLDALDGNIKIKLNGQYAVDFLYFNFMLDKVKMKAHINTWLRENLNDMMETRDTKWAEEEQSFIINISCRIPNSVTKINTISYMSIGKLFNKILPVMDADNTEEGIFYFPGYSSININLLVSNLTDKIHTESDGFNLKYEYAINPGPYNATERDIFFNGFRKISGDFNIKYKLMNKVN